MISTCIWNHASWNFTCHLAGKMVIEFCQKLDLHIVNGRFGKDLGTGKKT